MFEEWGQTCIHERFLNDLTKIFEERDISK